MRSWCLISAAAARDTEPGEAELREGALLEGVDGEMDIAPALAYLPAADPGVAGDLARLASV
jgi:hypothetical protein